MLNAVIYCDISCCLTGVAFYMAMCVFPERRWARKWTSYVMGMFVFVLAVIQAWQAWLTYVSVFQTAVYALVNALLFYAFFSCTFAEALLLFGFWQVNIAILKLPVLFLRGVWNNRNLTELNQYGASAIGNVWCLILLLILLCFSLRKKKELQLFVRQILEQKKRRIGLGLFEILEIFLLYVLLDLGSLQIELKDIALSLLLILSLFLGIGIWLFYTSYHMMEEEQATMRMRQELMAREQNMLRAQYEEEAKRLHDTKHLLTYLESCMQQKEYGKAQECLEEKRKLGEQKRGQVWTGIPALDFLLNYEHGKMKAEEIPFVLHVDVQTLPIPETDFMVMMGNLLDNAIEAAEKCNPAIRKISLTLEQKNEMLFLQISNTATSGVKEKDGKIFTSKKNALGHGWGIKSVREIVEKYEGYFQYRYENGVFEVTVMFYGNAKNSKIPGTFGQKYLVPMESASEN